jgi:anthranilate phosphoribosyltransferase
MAMRMKGESLPELQGFLDAAEAFALPLGSLEPVVVVPSYNGSRRLPNLTPLLALALAREGVRVLVHGPMADPRRVTSAEILASLGVPPALHAGEVERAWGRREPAFVPTRLLCPPLAALLDLRLALGVRGPGHTVAKMLRGVQGAPVLRLVNHTHPEFGALMAQWAATGEADAMLLRGTEGEPVADPRRLPRIDTWIGGRLVPAASAPAQDGALADLPWLPADTSAAGTALYVQEVLSGMRPAPLPLQRQLALVRAAVAQLALGEPSCAGQVRIA